MAFVVDVLPFTELLDVTANINVNALCPSFIWEAEGVPWLTEFISNILSHKTKPALHLHITIAKWCDITIALSQQIQERKVEDPTCKEAINYTLQASHSAVTESHHYALDAASIQGIIKQTLRAFLKVSLAWHQYLKLGGPSSTTEGLDDGIHAPESPPPRLSTRNPASPPPSFHSRRSVITSTPSPFNPLGKRCHVHDKRSS